MDFDIAPNTSVRASRLRNLRYSADPLLARVFLSPPPSPSPLMSSAPVPPSSSSSSFERSENFDENYSPLCPDEASSSLSLASKSTVYDEYEELPKPIEYVQSKYSENVLNSMNAFFISLVICFMGSRFKILGMSWYNSMKTFPYSLVSFIKEYLCTLHV